MGHRKMQGLKRHGAYWYIDKQIFGRRIWESTKTDNLVEAEKYLLKRIEEVRQAQLLGVRPQRIFRAAATKYLEEYRHMASIIDYAMHLKELDCFIGDLALERVHNGSLQTFIKARKSKGIKTKTINLALGVVRRVLNIAASEWIDENGLTWLHAAPKIKLLTVDDARKPYPLSWDEQIKLFNELPLHLRNMVLFKVNTGCREQEVCRLQWDWEIKIPELNTSVFLIPGTVVKNREDRLVVLNETAKSVIEQVRGVHPKFVFTYKGHPVTGIHNTAWERARNKTNLRQVRVHDLKHTFGRRLRAAGVSFEDRQDLLGHKSGRITTHYSAAELHKLIEAANKVCDRGRQGPVLTLLRRSYEVDDALKKVESHKTRTLEVMDKNRRVGI